VPHKTPNLSVLLERAKVGIQALKAYLDAGGFTDALVHDEGATARQLPLLHYMALRNIHPHTELAECVRLLVGAGADINITAGADRDARNALMLASTRSCCTGVVHVLLQNGADVLASNTKGITALHVAAASGHKHSCELLLAKQSSSVHVKDVYGFTALMYAVRFGSVETVEALQQHGADINTVDCHGTTPLIAAAGEVKRVDVIGHLLTAGADVNAVDNEGRTALVAAVDHNSVPIVQLLLNHGADIRLSDNAGYNALFTAAGKGYVFIMDMLVKRGASVIAVDNKGNTLLMAAASNKHELASEWLVQHGVAVNAANSDGVTALHVASVHSSTSNTALVELLLANGADVHMQDKNGV
jgi:ankyrin repeat protein